MQRHASSIVRHSGSWLAVLVIASAFLGNTQAFAEDGKVYPATMCQGSLVGNPPIIRYDGKQVVNNSTTNSAVVVCPALKDDVFSVTGANEAYVRYHKGTNTGLLCDLWSYSAYGTSHYVQFKSDFGAPGYKVFSYNPIQSFMQGYYSFVCVIPPGPAGQKSSVISYRLDEN
jgi:hypothetical protein